MVYIVLNSTYLSYIYCNLSSCNAFLYPKYKNRDLKHFFWKKYKKSVYSKKFFFPLHDFFWLLLVSNFLYFLLFAQYISKVYRSTYYKSNEHYKSSSIYETIDKKYKQGKNFEKLWLKWCIAIMRDFCT